MRLAILRGAFEGGDVYPHKASVRFVPGFDYSGCAAVQVGPARDPPEIIPAVVGLHFSVGPTLLGENHCRPPIKKNTVFQVITQGPCQYPPLNIPPLTN
jgi:hypothetical protein